MSGDIGWRVQPKFFTVLIDNKNFKYTCTSERLNPLQAQIRFNFVLSFWPGSKNLQADSLSKLKLKEKDPEPSESILLFMCWINAIYWKVDKELETTMPYHIPECPADRKYVPHCLKSKVIIWAHISPASVHPGTRKAMLWLNTRLILVVFYG